MKRILLIGLTILVLLTGILGIFLHMNLQKNDVMNLEVIPLTKEFERLTFPFRISGMFSFRYNIQEIQERFDDICIRKNEEHTYAIARVNHNDKNMYLFMFLDENDCLKDSMLIDSLLDKSEFNKLQVNVSTDKDVMELDCATYIYYAEFGEDTNLATSYHRCKDGTFVEIVYSKQDNTLVVDGIIFMKGGADYKEEVLLSKDLKLIS